MNGPRTRALREEMGMDVSQFANLFAVRENTVYRWERGDSQPAGLSAVLLDVLDGLDRRNVNLDSVLADLEQRGRIVAIREMLLLVR